CAAGRSSLRAADHRHVPYPDRSADAQTAETVASLRLHCARRGLQPDDAAGFRLRLPPARPARPPIRDKRMAVECRVSQTSGSGRTIRFIILTLQPDVKRPCKASPFEHGLAIARSFLGLVLPLYGGYVFNFATCDQA